MKKLFASSLLVAGLTAAFSAANAQTKPASMTLSDAPRYEYCEVRIVGDAVYADFGYGSEKLGGPELSKLEVGKLQVFATPISALNYMGSLGWEVLQVVQVGNEISMTKNGTKGNRYYVLRRLRSSTGINVTK
jgi:hypothetical protein